MSTNTNGEKRKTNEDSTCTLMSRRKKNIDELEEFMEAMNRRYVSNNYSMNTNLMYVLITMWNDIITLFNLQENSIEVKKWDTIATKVCRYPDWPQIAKVVAVKKSVCLVQWYIEEEDGHFTTWTKDNGTEITEQIKMKEILFPVTLNNGYLGKSDKIKIDSLILL